MLAASEETTLLVPSAAKQGSYAGSGAASSPRSAAAAEPVEGKRWLLLLIYIWIGFNQAVVITFSASAPEAKMLYGKERMTADTINFLLSWGQVTALVATPPVMWLLSRGSTPVYNTILLGAVFGSCGSLVRMLPTAFAFTDAAVALPIVHFGQFLNGVTGIAAKASCGSFAATWFAKAERTSATAATFGVCAFGPAVAFVFAMSVRTAADLNFLMYCEAASSVMAMLCWAVMPTLPKLAPSASQQAKRDALANAPTADISSDSSQKPKKSVVGEWLQACENHSFMLIILSGGMVFGVFQCWSGSLANMMPICSPELPATDFCMTEQVVQQVAFGSNLGAAFGMTFIGVIADRFYSRRFKTLLLQIFAVSLVLMTLFTLSMPIGIHPAMIQGNALWLTVLVAVGSMFLGSTVPLQIELGAEITYPADASVTAGLLSFLMSIGGVLVLASLSSIDSSYYSALVTATIFGGALMLVPVREEYKRSDFDSKASS